MHPEAAHVMDWTNCESRQSSFNALMTEIHGLNDTIEYTGTTLGASHCLPCQHLLTDKFVLGCRSKGSRLQRHYCRRLLLYNNNQSGTERKPRLTIEQQPGRRAIPLGSRRPRERSQAPRRICEIVLLRGHVGPKLRQADQRVRLQRFNGLSCEHYQQRDWQ